MHLIPTSIRIWPFQPPFPLHVAPENKRISRIIIHFDLARGVELMLKLPKSGVEREVLDIVHAACTYDASIEFALHTIGVVPNIVYDELRVSPVRLTSCGMDRLGFPVYLLAGEEQIWGRFLGAIG